MNFQEKYSKEIVSQLKQSLGYKNTLSVPRLEKIVLNVGLSRSKMDKSEKFGDIVKETLRRITGQQPVFTKAKKSISNFKVREGMLVGAKVTLRGKRMYDFFEKLIRIALPRMRDFRGISSKAVDQKGNLNVGFSEHIVFPEIRSDEVDTLHGLEVSIHTTCKNRDEGMKLFEAFGFPFEK